MLNKEQAILNEGIGLILSRWDTMQLAVEYGFGVRHSHAKAERIVSKVFDYFTQTIDPIDTNGVVYILVKGLLDELHTLVAEKLLTWYEQCIDDNYQILDELRVTKSQPRASVVKVSNGSSDDEDEDTWMDNDETIDMMMDASDHCSNRKPEAMPVDEQMADDGWTLVPCRKHKGNRN